MKCDCMTPLKRVKRNAEAEQITGMGLAENDEVIRNQLSEFLTKTVVDGGWIDD